jgi:hypothetical protein
MLEEHKRLPEARLTEKEVVIITCEMPKHPPNPNCDDCQLGFFLCVEHMGICGKPAAIACNYCSRPTCESKDCLAKICCNDYANYLTTKPATTMMKPLSKKPAETKPIDECTIENGGVKVKPVLSTNLNSMPAGVSLAMSQDCYVKPNASIPCADILQLTMTEDKKLPSDVSMTKLSSTPAAAKPLTLPVDVQPQSDSKQMKVDNYLAREIDTSIVACVGDNLETSFVESSRRSKGRHSQRCKKVKRKQAPIKSSSSPPSSSSHKEASDQCYPKIYSWGGHASNRC